MGIFDWLFGKKETSSKPEKEEVIKSYHDNGKIKSELRKLISELDGDLKNTSYEGSPYNGIGYDLHKNGELFIEGKYKNGKQEGEWKTYYDNGQLDIIGQYKNGKMNGKFKFYNKDGVLSRETDYIAGKEDGLSIQWYHSGVKYCEQKWWLGKMISEKYWDENGNEINPEKINEINNRHEERKKNKKTGTVKEYYENGKLNMVVNYSNGEVTGPFEKYNEEGNLILEGNFINFKYDGFLIQYNDDGVISDFEYHENGVNIKYQSDKIMRKVLEQIKNKMENKVDIHPLVYMDVCTKLGHKWNKEDDPLQIIKNLLSV